jgi:transposase-like protein
MNRQTISKEAIIADYLAGETTSRKLSAKYSIKHQTIYEWVLAYQGKRRESIKANHLSSCSKKDQPSESRAKKLQKET